MNSSLSSSFTKPSFNSKLSLRKQNKDGKRYNKFLLVCLMREILGNPAWKVEFPCTAPVELGSAVRHIRTPISFVSSAFLLFRVSLSAT